MLPHVGGLAGHVKRAGEGSVMAQSFSITYDNRGKMGQAVDFNPDNDRNGLWIEGSDFPAGESGGIFMNGNVICLWSPETMTCCES
jgi:hypothetical protein